MEIQYIYGKIRCEKERLELKTVNLKRKMRLIVASKLSQKRKRLKQSQEVIDVIESQLLCKSDSNRLRGANGWKLQHSS